MVTVPRWDWHRPIQGLVVLPGAGAKGALHLVHETLNHHRLQHALWAGRTISITMGLSFSADALTPGETGSFRSPPQELERFRVAFEGLQELLQEASRSDRYKPSDDLTLTRIRFGDLLGAPEVVGEILDLNADGMKIAMAVSHPVEVDQRCQLRVGPPEADGYELVGTVRWVDRNPYITVFGLALDQVLAAKAL